MLCNNKNTIDAAGQKLLVILRCFIGRNVSSPMQITTLIVLKSQLHVCYFFRLTKKVLKHAIKQRTEKREQQTRQVESLHTFFDICFRVFDISYLQHYTFSWRLLCMAPKHGRNRRQLPFNYLPFFCLRA